MAANHLPPLAPKKGVALSLAKGLLVVLLVVTIKIGKNLLRHGGIMSLLPPLAPKKRAVHLLVMVAAHGGITNYSEMSGVGYLP